MIEIDYELSPSDSFDQMRVEPSTASDAHLRYDFFLGDLVLRVDGVDLSARWRWIPLLDVAACLYLILQELESGKQQAIFDFTESSETIQFERGPRGEVCISSSYASGRGCVDIAAFKAAVLDFSRRVLLDAFNKYPSLRHNTDLRSWYPPADEPRTANRDLRTD
jgi:hypothetical protein